MGVSQYVKKEMVRLKEENALLQDEVRDLRNYIESIQALMEAVDALDPSAEIMPLLDRILYNAQSLINASEGSLLVLDDETDELVFVLVRGASGDQLLGQRMPATKGIAGWVVQNRKPTIVNNARSDDRFYARIDRNIQFQTRSILAAPIVGGGKVLGVIEVLNKQDGEPFNETDRTLLALLCRFAGEVLYVMLQQDEQPEPSPASVANSQQPETPSSPPVSASPPSDEAPPTKG